MRLNTVGTGSWQARNAGRPRQLRNLALAGVFLLAACGRSETDRENDRLPTPPIRPAIGRARCGLSAHRRLGVVRRRVGRRKPRGRDRARHPAERRQRHRRCSRHVLCACGDFAVCGGPRRLRRLHRARRQDQGRRGLRVPADRRAGDDQRPAVHRAVGRARHHADAHPPWPAALGADRLRRPNGWPASACRCRARCRATCRPALRLLGSDRETRRIFGKGAGGMVTEGDIWTQSRSRGDAGRDPPARRRRILPGRAGAHPVRPGVADGRQHAARGVAQRRAASPGRRPPSPMAAERSMSRRRRLPAPRRWPAGKARRRAGPAPTNSGGFSGLVAVDSKAGAVACTLSMGQLFGARAIVPGTGVLLGAATPDAGSVSPVIIASANNGEFTFAGAGGGAPTAAQATGAVARATVEEDKDIVAVLNARGGQGGTVNAIVCPSGLRSSAATCRSAHRSGRCGARAARRQAARRDRCRASSRAAAARSIRSSSWM